MPFKYVKRDPAMVEARTNQVGANYDGPIISGVKIYSVRTGENVIRIMPATWDVNGKAPEHYGYDVWVHGRIGPDNEMVICLAKQFEDKCPICEARESLDRRGDEETAKGLKPVRRVFMWIIDRKDESKGPQIFQCPWTLDQDIAKASKNKRSGTYYVVEDPEEGHDISFEKEGANLATRYVTVQVEPSSSALASNEKQTNALIEYIAERPIPNLLNVKTYEQIARLYRGGGYDDEPAVADPAPSPKSPKLSGSGAAKAVIPEDELPTFEKPPETKRVPESAVPSAAKSRAQELREMLARKNQQGGK